MKTRIAGDIKSAMLAKDTVKRDVLRVVKGEIERKEQDPKKGKVDVSDKDIIKLIKKMYDNIQEIKGENFEYEGDVLNEYLPEMLTTDEVFEKINEIIDDLEATGLKDMGKVMGEFNAKYSGQADGKFVSQIASKQLG